MRTILISCMLFCLCILSGSPAYALTQDVDPEAQKLFKQMCDYMASLKAYSVTSEVFEDRVFSDGQKIQYHRISKTIVQKPDKVHTVTLGDGSDTLSIINGKQFALLDQTSSNYQLVDVPAGLDKAVDFLLEKFDLNVPTADLIKDDPYAAIFPNIISGQYIQAVEMDGKLYHHLAFRQLLVDWQVWIADGDAPLPIRIVITDKTQHGNPQFMIVYKDWNMSPEIKEGLFHFTPPEGAEAAELLQADEDSDENPGSADPQ